MLIINKNISITMDVIPTWRMGHGYGFKMLRNGGKWLKPHRSNMMGERKKMYDHQNFQDDTLRYAFKKNRFRRLYRRNVAITTNVKDTASGHMIGTSDVQSPIRRCAPRNTAMPDKGESINYGEKIDKMNVNRRPMLQAGLVGALHAMAIRCAPGVDAAELGRAEAATSDVLSRRLEERVNEFTLPNGMKFLCYERRSAPIVSFYTYADVGAFDEPDGSTGIAHLLEHMAFKGTPQVGTTNFKKESALLEYMDDVFYSMIDSKSEKQKARLQKQLDKLQDQASNFQVTNEYGRILTKEGAVGLNAATTHDSTTYTCSLPSNKLELWFALESERFKFPVFRELYSEKKVVFEERRLRVDNAPLGPFQEAFSQASLTNNYRRPVIGYPNDLKRIGRREIASFFKKYYGPSNLTVGIVGDINPDKVRHLAEKYFGDWQTDSSIFRTENVLMESLPKPLNREMNLKATSAAGPALIRAWYRPSARDISTSIAIDAFHELLTGSRSARLEKNLVEKDRALLCSSFPTYPADKHPCQTSIYAVPAEGYDIETLDSLIYQELDKLLNTHTPTVTELRRYSAAARSSLLQVLQSNAALATSLTSYQVLFGSWRNIPLEIQQIESLTAQQIIDRAGKYLGRENSFVGYILPYET